MFDPDRYSALIVSDPEFLVNARLISPELLRIEVWHAVAAIAAAEWRRAPDDTSIPDINNITDAVLPLVIERIRGQSRSDRTDGASVTD
jgi:hypothetical protein